MEQKENIIKVMDGKDLEAMLKNYKMFHTLKISHKKAYEIDMTIFEIVK